MGIGILTKYIDINQIKCNICDATKMSGTEVMAVVKADCYSNGIMLANAMQDYVCGFAVANVFEGARLRKMGITKPILSLSFLKEEYDICKRFDISVAISTPANYVGGLKYHIAIDSGMNRSGVKGKSNLKELLKCIKPCDIEGVYSHICSPNEVLASKQIAIFEEMLGIVRQFNPYVLTHIFATNYKLFGDILHTDFVRLGIGLYQNAVGVTSHILQIKEVKKGQSVGYDAEFTATKPIQIALCEGGYFDGIIRRFKNQKMGFSTDFCKVVGKISMDSHIIDVTDLNAKIGDSVVVYDTDELSFCRRAEDMNISEYELMTALKGRFEYVYFN